MTRYFKRKLNKSSIYLIYLFNCKKKYSKNVYNMGNSNHQIQKFCKYNIRQLLFLFKYILNDSKINNSWLYNMNVALCTKSS